MRESVSSSMFATQTPPAPVVTASGATPTGTSATSLFDAGSMTPTEFGETDERPTRAAGEHERRDCCHERERRPLRPRRSARRDAFALG